MAKILKIVELSVNFSQRLSLHSTYSDQQSECLCNVRSAIILSGGGIVA